MGLIILYLLGALALSFLCSILEAVLLSTPMSFISMKESQGNKTASLMKRYKNNVDRPVGAILSLNTIAHTIDQQGMEHRIDTCRCQRCVCPLCQPSNHQFQTI